jgi:hypothetical protein
MNSRKRTVGTIFAVMAVLLGVQMRSLCAAGDSLPDRDKVNVVVGLKLDKLHETEGFWEQWFHMGTLGYKLLYGGPVHAYCGVHGPSPHFEALDIDGLIRESNKCGVPLNTYVGPEQMIYMVDLCARWRPLGKQIRQLYTGEIDFDGDTVPEHADVTVNRVVSAGYVKDMEKYYDAGMTDLAATFYEWFRIGHSMNRHLIEVPLKFDPDHYPGSSTAVPEEECVPDENPDCGYFMHNYFVDDPLCYQSDTSSCDKRIGELFLLAKMYTTTDKLQWMPDLPPSSPDPCGYPLWVSSLHFYRPIYEIFKPRKDPVTNFPGEFFIPYWVNREWNPGDVTVNNPFDMGYNDKKEHLYLGGHPVLDQDHNPVPFDGYLYGIHKDGIATRDQEDIFSAACFAKVRHPDDWIVFQPVFKLSDFVVKVGDSYYLDKDHYDAFNALMALMSSTPGVKPTTPQALSGAIHPLYP